MKYLIASLFLVAFLSTGFSKPLEDADIPPIRPIGAHHSMVYGLAKQTLTILQNNLKNAGHVDGVKKIGDFIDKTEKMVDEYDVDALERFDLDNHIDNVYDLIEEYESYLPDMPDTKIPLIVPTTRELLEYLLKQVAELIVRLEAKGEAKKAKLLKYYKHLLAKIIENKGKFLNKEQIERIISSIVKTIRRFTDKIIGSEPEPYILEEEENSSSDTIIKLLDSLIQDMETIEEGLKKDNKFREAEKIRLNKLMFKKIRMNTNTENANRYSVRYALAKGAKLTYQYSKYLKKDTSYLLTNQIFGDEDDIFLPIY